MSAILAIVALLLVVLYIKGQKKAPDQAKYWGIVYKRKIELVKGEIASIKVDRDGKNQCQVYFPSVDGYATLSFEEDVIKEVRENEEKAKDGEPTTVVAFMMRLPRDSQAVSLPGGQIALLGKTKLASERDDEHDVPYCEEIQNRIRNITYERNALLVCAAILLILHPFVSLLCTAGALYMAVTNVEFGLFTNGEINGIIWTKVKHGKGAIKNRPKAAESGKTVATSLNDIDRLLHDILDALPNSSKQEPCKICGCLLDADSGWEYCPHCGSAIEKEAEQAAEEDIEEPAAPEPDFDIEDLSDLPNPDNGTGDTAAAAQADEDEPSYDDDDYFSMEEDLGEEVQGFDFDDGGIEFEEDDNGENPNDESSDADIGHDSEDSEEDDVLFDADSLLDADDDDSGDDSEATTIYANFKVLN